MMCVKLCTIALLLVVFVEKARSFTATPRANALLKNAVRHKAISLGSSSSSAHLKLQGTALFDRGLSSREDDDEEKTAEFDPAAWLNPNTRGGVLVWCAILLIAPVSIYEYLVSTGMDSSKVGGYVGALFVLISNVLWASTYIFRVANKDMTYAKQLKDYENAVLQKRLEELQDDEIDALMEEIELEDDE